MKYLLTGLIMMLFFMLSCNEKYHTVLGMEKGRAFEKPVNWMPYRTAKGDYVYVNEQLEKKIDLSFAHAEPFLPTGFAFVGDTEGRSALIDTDGNLIVGYVDDKMELAVVGDLTLLLKVREYDKKMMPWKWEWNILGGAIQKKQTYHWVEIFVLESQQLLFSADVPYDENPFNLNFQQLDEQHLVMNDILYQVQGKKLKKLRKHIDYVLEGGRFIPHSSSTFDIYGIKEKGPLLSALSGTHQLELTVHQEPLLLDSINLDRYAPAVPKLLVDQKTQAVYAYPQYDKAFPKEIKQATATQLEFLKQTSLVYAIHNSPYFILGRFNYDHEVWAYDWLYLDVNGNLHSEIATQNFYIRDQVGYLIWPDKQMILSPEVLEKEWKIGKISYVNASENLYIVATKIADQAIKKGLWNASTQEWELEPLFHSIEVLNSSSQLFALQKQEGDNYAVYNHNKKQAVSSAKYAAVYSSGQVRVKQDGGKELYYYIDLTTGKEYKD